MTRYSRVTTEERVTTVVYKSQAMKRGSAMAAQDAGLLNMRPYTPWLVMGAALILGLAAELKTGQQAVRNGTQRAGLALGAASRQALLFRPCQVRRG